MGSREECRRWEEVEKYEVREIEKGEGKLGVREKKKLGINERKNGETEKLKKHGRIK